MVTAGKPIASLRWWIGSLLFASTVINYIDRQTLSLLAPYLKLEYHWSNSDYANIAIAFRVAYSIGQTVFGRLMDRIGTRRGLTLTVIWYSLVSMLTSLASGFYSFATFRLSDAGFCNQHHAETHFALHHASVSIGSLFESRDR
jgi:ACS family hexuronate transporter-like MFS transporter